MKKGSIIFLNGVSSAGKSTLSKLLQEKLNEPYFYIAQDVFTHLIAPCFNGKFDGENINELWIQAVSAMHHTIKLYSDLGYNVIVDHVLTSYTDENGKSDNSLQECVRLLYDYPVLLVKVSCSLEEMRRRELKRGDRAPGTAEWQLQYLVPTDAYDVLVDTSRNTMEECAEIIKEAVRHINNNGAFKKMHQE